MMAIFRQAFINGFYRRVTMTSSLATDERHWGVFNRPWGVYSMVERELCEGEGVNGVGGSLAITAATTFSGAHCRPAW